MTATKPSIHKWKPIKNGAFWCPQRPDGVWMLGWTFHEKATESNAQDFCDYINTLVQKAHYWRDKAMSTNDVPGAKASNNDQLAMGCWAEHKDGSLIFVESVEADTVVYSIFDVAQDPPVEYRDAMPEKGFKDRFSWPTKDNIKWTWHDKTPFPWTRVMANFPPTAKKPSAAQELSAAARVAASLQLRAEDVRESQNRRPTMQRAARTIMTGIGEAIAAIRP